MAHTLVVVPRSRETTELSGEKLTSYPSPLIADRISILKSYFDKVILVGGWKDGNDEVIHGSDYEYHKIKITDERLKSNIKYISRLANVLNREDNPIVLNFDPNLIGAAIGIVVKATNTPLVTKFIGLPEQDPGVFGKSRLGFKILLSVSDKVVTISPYCKERLQEISNRDIAVVTNRVRGDFKQMNVQPIENSILYAGRFDTEKRVHLLMKAFSELTNRLDDAKLLLVGEADHYHRELAQSLGISKQTEFLGRVSRTEIPKWMNKATIFAYPTKEEAFGMALIEAMACGTPVVGANSGSIPWVIGDGGIVVDPNDRSEFSQALHQMISNDSYRARLQIQALNRAEDFSYESWGSDLYRNIVCRN